MPENPGDLRAAKAADNIDIEYEVLGMVSRIDSLTSGVGYERTFSRSKLKSALPPTTDIPRPTLDFRF